MPENLLYEYAVVRIVPRVERGEFINTGIILYSRDAGFLKMCYRLDEDKVRTLYSGADIEKLRSLLRAIESVCHGEAMDSEISKLPPAGRFRWLTAQRSTMIQMSPVHPGLTSDPGKKLKQLFNELIL